MLSFSFISRLGFYLDAAAVVNSQFVLYLLGRVNLRLACYILTVDTFRDALGYYLRQNFCVTAKRKKKEKSGAKSTSKQKHKEQFRKNPSERKDF